MRGLTMQRAGFWALPLTLLFALLVAAWAVQPPPPRAPSADNPGADLGPMLADLRAITRAPHITGSAENARVRDHVRSRLDALGLQTEVQSGFGIRQSLQKGQAISLAPVENVIAILPGKDRGGPAVAVMAHYDSVPFSPGASDDGAGTVALIETARVLAAGPQPARDVVFLFTEGEEFGLTGAQMFFDAHPLARRIAIVVNAEARGSRGRAMMFQTSTGNAELIDLWAGSAISPTGNSLSDAIYKILPNDTDMSVSLDKGIAGINAAYVDGYFDYHSPTDNFANISRRSLQHLGDFTLTTVRALAVASELPGRTASATYFDIFGFAVVRYPPPLGWVPLALAAFGLVLLMRHKDAVRPRALLGGFSGSLAMLLVVGGALHFWGGWLYDGGAIAYRENQAEAHRMLWAYGGLIVAALMVVRPRAALPQGAALLLLIGGAALQIFLPGGAFLLAWPALIAVGVALVSQRWGAASPFALAAAVLIGGLTLAWLLSLVYFFYVSVGTMSAGIVALALPFALALAGPVLSLWSERRSGQLAGLAALAASVGWGIWLWESDGFSARQPRPGDFLALANADTGQRYWATTSGKDELPPGESTRFAFAPVSRTGFTVQAAAMAPFGAETRPQFGLEPTPGGATLRVRTETNPRLFRLALRPSGPLAAATLNGKAVRLPPGEWSMILYRASRPADLVLRYRAAAGVRIEARYLLAIPGLPPGAPRDGGTATNWTLLNGTRTVVGSWTSDGRPVADDPPQ